MSSMQSLIGTLPGTLICLAALLLAGSLLGVLLRLLREKLGTLRVLAALAHFLLLFFLLCVLTCYSYNAITMARPGDLHNWELRLLGLPWLLWAGTELVSAAILRLHLRAFKRDRESRLTADVIRQTVDRLSAGLMVSEADGTVLLANLKMAALCRRLTGELLSDAGRFWQYIEDHAEDRLIRTAEGEAWQFAKCVLTLDGKNYDQITAVEMTEQYRVTEELSEKNRHLKAVQERMKAVAAKERSLVAEREVMNARMTVHNRMGAVLLSGKYYLDHPENVKEEELLRLLEFNSHFLLGEAEQPEGETDALQRAIRTAERIGVAVEFRGEPPKDGIARTLVAQAVDQCAANTVRHAGGDRLTVTITGDGNGITAAYSNNGRAPEGPVTETGGLAGLRRAAEAAGGSMTVRSEPAFLLTITVPGQA